jgi:hypothetical protein
MPNSGRRRLLTLMGAGALASQAGLASEPVARNTRTPRALVNAVGVRLQKSSAGTTVIVIDYAGTLDAGNHLHAVGGQLEFAHQPTKAELARAVKDALIRIVLAEPGVSLAAQDITVVAPTFL